MRRRALGASVVAFLAMATFAQAQVVTGTYTGNGTAGRAFTGLGFQPELVIIKVDDTGLTGVARTSTMAGGTAPIWGNTGLAANQITSLDADGFTIGNDILVNGLNVCAGASPCQYYWTAFNADSNIFVGSYGGDGGATQAITGVGFAVDYVMIYGEGARWARNRTSFASTTVLGAGANFRIRNSGENSTSISSLDADGFTVGDGATGQDDANENGVTYHYVAFNDAPGAIDVGMYTGDGGNPRDVTGVGFQPIYVVVQSLDDGDQAFQKSDQMAAASSSDFLNAVIGSRVVGLIADGFQVSNDARVNTGGEDYAYIAFSGAAGGGTLTLANHDAGQAPDAFTSASSTTDVMFRFKLSRTPTVTITDIRAQYTTGSGVVNADVTAGALYRDNNNDGVVDGGDTLLDSGVSGAGDELDFNGLSEDPGAGANYLVVATVNNLVPGDTTTFSLGAADIDQVEVSVVESGSISNAVQTANAAASVYYSVGTSGADFKAGAPTITISSGTATFSTAQPANVGLGDEITYNGGTKAYISGRSSAFVYTVTTAVGLTPPDIGPVLVTSIRRAFPSLSLAHTGSSDGTHLTTSDLVVADVQLNWVCYNDGPMDDMLDLTGWTTSPTNYIRIFTPVTPAEVGISQRHYGVEGTGFRLTPADATSQPYNIIYLRTGYVRIEGLEIDGSGLTNAVYVRGITVLRDLSNVGDIRIDSMVIHDLHTRSGAVAFEATMGILAFHDDPGEGPPLRISNNIIYDLSSTLDVGHLGGIHVGARGTSYVYNNTVYRIINNPGCALAACGPSWGIYAKAFGGGAVTVQATNNYVGDVQGKNSNVFCYDTESGGVLNQSNNVASDLSASGPGSVDSQSSYVNYFADITPGSENLHLLSDSSTLWGTTGTDLSGDANLPITDDVDAEPRHPSTPDVGADEAVVTTNYRSIGTAPSYSAGTIDVTAGSAIVTGTSTAFLTANRGRGDHIAFNLEEYTVLSVDSETQLTLTTPVTSTFTGGYAISRQFTTLQSWEDCISGAGGCTFFAPASGSLVSDDRAEVGIAYNDSVVPADPDFTVELNISGATTDATHTITLTADPLNRHYGVIGNGVLLDCGTCTTDAIRVRTDYTTVEWVEVIGATANGSDAGIKLQDAFNQLVRFVLVHDNQNGIRLSSFPGKSATIRNSIVYNNVEVGIEGDEVGDVLVVENTTVFGNGTRGVWAAASTGTVTARNVISMNSAGTSDFLGVTIQENNISWDATASCGTCLANRDFTDLAAPGPPPQGNGWVMFSSLVATSENFHLRDNVALNDAQDNAQDLSGSFLRDIDAGVRMSPWDIGADDAAATTAVELLTFDAESLDGAVTLSWETGSELDNLGFHLYRSTSLDGERARITADVIPGLGSSPAGASYRYRDDDVTNGVTYYYRLEDIDVSGAVTLHGPVEATPRASFDPTPVSDDEGEPDSRSLITFGDPSANRFEVLSRDDTGALVRLWTEGFYAEPAGNGRVILSAPGLEPTGDGLAVPVSRAWIEAVTGVGVKITHVDASDVASFASLEPFDAESFDLVATTEGVVRTEERSRATRRRGWTPRRVARVRGTRFRGETKHAELELSPLRWNANRGELRLARVLTVRVNFIGKPRDEFTGTGRYRRQKRQDVIARFTTADDGLHVVHYREIFGAGRTVYDTGSLRLSRLDEAVPFHVEPDPDAIGPGSKLYFVSEGAEANIYDTVAVYELEWSDAGVRMEVARATPSGEGVSHYWKTIARERDNYYQPALLSAPDRWLWDVLMSGQESVYTIDVDDVAASPQSGRVSIWLQGASDFEAYPDHHVSVSVNGVFLAEAAWDGKTPHRIDADLPPGVILSGSNSLELKNVGDTDAAYSMVFVDRFELVYPRELTAGGGRLSGEVRSTGSATLHGIGSDARVVDVTDRGAPVWLTDLGESIGGHLSFHVEAGRRYAAVSRALVLNPIVGRPARVALRKPRRSVEYLLIGPEAFLETAEPLARLRRGQRLRVKSVSVEQIWDEFGHGERRPEAIRDFLRYAYHEWRGPRLRYVLLLGDGTYDFKDHMQTGAANPMPPLMVPTSYLWTASDPTLAMIAGDDSVPDVAIGRLPAQDVDELQAMVDKILAFENGEASFETDALVLVADNADRAGDFVADANEIATSVLPSERVDKIYLSELGRSSTRSEIVRAFDDGASLMSYMGHGGINLWADENIFNLGDVDGLSGQSQQPLFITMNCLNGYFHFPFFDSLSERLVKAEGRGAIAAFSPTGLSLNTPAHRFHKALLDAVVHQDHERLGDAVLDAQERYGETGAFPELLAIYHLIGDPALRLK